MMWLLTREEADNQRLLLRCQAMGLSAFSVPCIERRGFNWPDWPIFLAHSSSHHASLSSQTPCLMMVTSAFVARGIASHHHRVAVANRLYLAALAPESARALQLAALPVDIAAEGGVLALAQAIVRMQTSWPPIGRIYYPTSDLGMASSEHAQALQHLTQMAPVDVASVYQTRAPEGLSESLQNFYSRLPPPYGLFFASPSAVHFFAQAHQASVSVAAAVCLGRSTYQALTQYRGCAWYPSRCLVVADLESAFTAMKAL